MGSGDADPPARPRRRSTIGPPPLRGNTATSAQHERAATETPGSRDSGASPLHWLGGEGKVAPGSGTSVTVVSSGRRHSAVSTARHAPPVRGGFLPVCLFSNNFSAWSLHPLFCLWYDIGEVFRRGKGEQQEDVSREAPRAMTGVPFVLT